jgi:hypothetical protein
MIIFFVFEITKLFLHFNLIRLFPSLSHRQQVAIIAGAVVGTAVAVGAVTVALPLLGFGAIGIAAGSPAAALMSSGVAPALVATGQSVAMGGLSALSWIGLGASGAAAGAVTGAVTGAAVGKKDAPPPPAAGAQQKSSESTTEPNSDAQTPPSVNPQKDAGQPQEKVTEETQEKAKQWRVNCIVCNKRPRNIVIFPCTHMVCCKECTEGLEKCPACSKPIAGKLPVITEL